MKTKPEHLAQELTENYFPLLLKEGFDGQFENMLRAFEKMRRARFTHGDFVGNPRLLSQFLSRGLKPYFWHSNAFSSNASYFVKSHQQLRQCYFTMALEAGRTLGTSARVNKFPFSFECYLGEENDILGYLTAGYGMSLFNPKDFIPVDEKENPIPNSMPFTTAESLS